MHGIKEKFFFQLLYASSQLLFPLITYPYLTRTIGAAGLGKVAFVEYCCTLIITVASFGIPFYGVREIAKIRDNPDKKYNTFNELFFLHLVVSMLGIAAFLLFINVGTENVIDKRLIILGCFNILLPVFVAEWYLQGTEAFKFTTIRNIVLRIAGIVVLFLIVKDESDFAHYFLLIILIQAAVALSNLYIINLHKIELPAFKNIRQHVKPLFHFFLTASIISVYVFFDVLILERFASDQAVGYYATAIKIVKLPLLLVLSLTVILFPRIAHLSGSADRLRIQELIQKSLQYIIITTVPLAFLFYFLSTELINVFAGEAFEPAAYLLQLLCTLPFIIGISNLFVYQVLIPFGKEKKLLLCVFTACLCSLALNIVFASAFAAKGTAIATLSTELIVTLFTGYFAFKALRFSIPVLSVLKSITACLPFVAMVLVIRTVLDNNFLIIVISSIFGFICYSLLQMFTFKNTIYQQIWIEVKERISLLKPNNLNA